MLRVVAASVLLQAFLAQSAAGALSEDEMREMEALLARLNFDPGPIDGVIDERTRAAITLYQQFAALPEDGEPNEALLTELRGVAGAFVDLKARRESQSGADAGVTGMRVEEASDAEAAPEGQPEATPEATSEVAPEASDEPTEPADEATAVATDEAAQAQASGDALPAPLPDSLPEPDTNDAEPERPQAESDAAAAITEDASASPAAEPVQPSPEDATTAPPQIAEEQPTKVQPMQRPSAEERVAESPAEEAAPKPSGFNIRNLLAKLIGATEEPEPAPAPEAAAPDPAADAPADSDPAGDEMPAPAEDPTAAEAQVPVAAGEDVAETPRESEPQIASLVRGGYAAFGAAYAAARDGSLERAIAAYTVALRSDDLAPEHAALAHYNRADALYRLRRYDEAITDYDAAIEKDPSFADAYYNRGYAYQASGDRRRAIADFRKARELGLQRVGDRAPSAPPPPP